MYTIKLTQYAFDNTYTNARLFENKTERDAYFENLQGYTFNKDVNFIARDIIATDIDIKVEPQTPLFVLLNYNYCVIKNDKETLYFYINKSEQLSGNLIRCRLENDIIQNYIYDVEFSDCLIKKAHLDRFINNGSNTVKFNGDANSKLFEREEIKNLSKRLINRQALVPKIDTPAYGGVEYSKFNRWISNNIVGWAYVLINADANGTEYKKYDNETFSIKPTGISESTLFAENYGLEYGTHGTFCFPIMKSGSRFLAKLENDTQDIEVSIGLDGLQAFRQLNGGNSKIYCIKVSAKPPLPVAEYIEDYDFIIDGNKMTLLCNTGIYPADGQKNGLGYIKFNQGQIGNKNVASAMFYIINDNPKPVEFYVLDNSVLPTLSFPINNIINSNRNIKYNPKLNNSDYKSLELCFLGSSHSYDIQKLNSTRPSFLYTEMISPDVSKVNIKFKSENNDNIFNEAYINSFNGLSITNDLMFNLSKDQLDLYLANNKNAYLSFQNQQSKERTTAAIGALGGLLGGIGNFAMGGNASSIMGASTSGFTNLAQTLSKQAYEQTQFNLSIDDMRSAPNELQNNNGNIFLAAAISNITPYVELYEALPNELEIANNFAYDKGFIYNQYDNIKNHIDYKIGRAHV